MKKRSVSAVCMKSHSGAVERNLDKTESFAGEAARSGADVICFPELSLTGYVLQDPQHICPPDIFSQAIARLEEIAGRFGIVVLAGLMEPSGDDRPYISHAVVTPDGILGCYRKTHLSPKEKGLFKQGERLDVFTWEGMNFGIMLCYETHFPEISTVMALRGARLLFAPHASPRGTPDEKRKSWMRHLPARAFDNSVYVVACNQTGKSREGISFPGVIVGIDPSGRLICDHARETEMALSIEIDTARLEEIRANEMMYFIPGRRPEIYSDVLKKSR